MLPPNDWWREPQLATAVNVTADEVAALTKLEADQNEIEKIERDSTVAVDDLRKLLASDQPSVADITAAGWTSSRYAHQPLRSAGCSARRRANDPDESAVADAAGSASRDAFAARPRSRRVSRRTRRISARRRAAA